MSDIRVIQTASAPAAVGPYSQAMVFNGCLFTSGQIPLDPVSGQVVGTNVREQAELVMKNVAAILDAAGTSFEKVIKTTCFLSDMAHFAEFNEIYAEYFVSKPARSCVAAKTLPKNVLCEVEVIAAV